MSKDEQPVFLVDAYSHPPVLKIVGRASYLNCNPIGPLFERLLKKGNQEIIVDFDECTGMDSTFLGILAGAAMQLRRTAPKGHLTFSHLGKRNLELVQNLGLDRLATVENSNLPVDFEDERCEEVHDQVGEDKAEAGTILKAHENLIRADEDNRGKFEDVIAYLKNQIEQR